MHLTAGTCFEEAVEERDGEREGGRQSFVVARHHHEDRNAPAALAPVDAATPGLGHLSARTIFLESRRCVLEHALELSLAQRQWPVAPPRPRRLEVMPPPALAPAYSRLCLGASRRSAQVMAGTRVGRVSLGRRFGLLLSGDHAHVRQRRRATLCLRSSCTSRGPPPSGARPSGAPTPTRSAILRERDALPALRCPSPSQKSTRASNPHSRGRTPDMQVHHPPQRCPPALTILSWPLLARSLINGGEGSLVVQSSGSAPSWSMRTSGA